jgi:hypothetical protein
MHKQPRRFRRAGQCQRRRVRHAWLPPSVTLRNAWLLAAQRAWFRGRGEGAYRAAVHSFSTFITEIAGEPRRATERCRAILSGMTERIIGLAIEVHRHSGPGLLESFYAAGLCRELARAGIRVRRKLGFRRSIRANLCRLGSGPISWRTKLLFWKSRRFPHCCRPTNAITDSFAYERSSGRPAIQLPRASAEGWPAALCWVTALCRVAGFSSPWPPVALVLPPC